MEYWSISPQVMVEEAEKLGLQVEILSKNKNFYTVSSQEKTLLFKGMDFGGNTALGAKIADDKELAYRFLENNNIRIPKTAYVHQENLADFFAQDVHQFPFPVIIKPIDGAHGHGVQMNIVSADELQEKLHEALAQYGTMIVQEQIDREECRVLVFGDEVLLAYKRVPPSVVGDGKKSLQELIDQENENPLRSEGYLSPLAKIRIDTETKDFLKKQGYTLSDIVPQGAQVQLRGNSNIGTGGTPEEITNILHPETKKICIEIAQKVGLVFCGIDIMSPDFSRPFTENAVVIEINANSGIGGNRELTSANPARTMLKKLFSV